MWSEGNPVVRAGKNSSALNRAKKLLPLSINLSENLVCLLMANPELKLLEDALIDDLYFNKTAQNYWPQQIHISDIQLLFGQPC